MALDYSNLPAMDAASDWVLRTWVMLATQPPLPRSSIYGTNYRMYALYEASAWASNNMAWLEEVQQLLADARYALALARNNSRDLPPPGDDIHVPGFLRLGRIPRPGTADEGASRRARLFRFHIDNAVFRISAAYQKIVGLLGSYYDIDLPFNNQLVPNSKLFRSLRSGCGDPCAVVNLASLIEAPEYVGGQEYRNPRVHGLGLSYRALVGLDPEIEAASPIVPGVVGIKPRPSLTADELFDLALAFYRHSVRFARHSLAFLRHHPRAFSKANPFHPCPVQSPVTHRSVLPDKNATDFATEFGPRDRIYVTAMIIRPEGEAITVKMRFRGRAEECDTVVFDGNVEKRLTVMYQADGGDSLPLGRASFEFWVDGVFRRKVRFTIVAPANSNLAATRNSSKRKTS